VKKFTIVRVSNTEPLPAKTTLLDKGKTMQKRLSLVLACCILSYPCMSSAAVTLVAVQTSPDSGPAVKNVARIFSDQISCRCDAKVIVDGKAPFAVELAIAPGLGVEGYEIADGSAGSVRILGNDNLGLLYGVGKFLRTSRYDQGGFTPGTWRGKSAPQCSFRAIYAATHFMNFYEAAPAEEVRQYTEELGLWGANVLIAGFPTWQLKDFDDPAAKKSLNHLRRLFCGARDAGMKVGLILCPNQGFASAPSATRAAKYPDALGRRGDLGVNCCPGKPEGHEYLMKLYGRLFDEFKDIGLDFLVCWPYDEGGCGCSNCWPWGVKGFPSMSRDLALLARNSHPHLKLVLSTWVYDTPPAGEWAGLAELLKKDGTWADAIMADAHEDFPRYPLEKGVPGGLPLVNFPEISMWGRGPWGAFGANPLPARLDRLWKQTQDKLSGGMPYSEGIYEDMNKVICFQRYWDKRQSAEQTLKEYAAFEYSPEVADNVLKLTRIFEETWSASGPRTLEARQLVEQINQKLTPQAQKAWRWRIVYLRAVIDSEIFLHQGKQKGQALKTAFDELRRIYHAEHAHPNVCVPTVVAE
jgi:hypothetical protein